MKQPEEEQPTKLMDEPQPLLDDPWATLPEVLGADPAAAMVQLIRRCGRLESRLEESERTAHDTVRGLLRALLDIVDDLDRILAQQPAHSVHLVRKKLLRLLERQGVTAIEALGQPFDPALAEAAGEEERDDLPEETVVQEVVTGYRWRGEVLRPAVVIVSRRATAAVPPAPP
ncbi:MAG: nucleotide exchange factor GrpE [Anaerolineae bacterium]|nr:nucleotide exchange factor GrpE [Anaerolineae bacterium]